MSSTIDTTEFAPTKANNLRAIKLLEDELETLDALSMVLMNRLEDEQETDLSAITSWRLSQVMNERLSNLKFLREMRFLLVGNESP